MNAPAGSSLPYKMIFIALGFTAYTVLIVLRLYYLQVVSYDHFLHRSKENFLRYETSAPLRGNIVDCNGKILATNKPQIHVSWKGTGKKQLTKEQLKKLEAVGLLCGTSFTERHQEIVTTEKRQSTIRLVNNLSFELLTLILEQFPRDENIIIETDSTRYYPHNSLASHALGYLGILTVSQEGRMGLEKWCEKALQGQKGYTEKCLNSCGKIMQKEEIQASQQGETIPVTIDIDIQKIAEESFPEGEKGVMIVLESATGKIKALLSRPSFDPNIFTNPLDESTWKNIQEQRPFVNRIFHATYPPGSVFKIVTIAAALEKKIITPETQCFCKGYVTVGNRKAHCSKKEGHGLITAVESVAHSCNTLFFILAKRIDIDTLAYYGHEFGLGVTINPQFKDIPGLLPTREWKKRVKGETWWQGETLSATIGQSFMLVTPLQVAQMMASIETGYLTQPHILENQLYERRPLKISSDTRDFLKNALAETIYHGTGRGLQHIKDFKMYAKTSTAQTSSLEKKDSGEKQYLEHRWLAINFSYEENPWMTLIILVENAPEKRSCTTTARQFLRKYKQLQKNRKKLEKST